MGGGMDLNDLNDFKMDLNVLTISKEIFTALR